MSVAASVEHASLGVQEDAGQHLHRPAARDGPRDDAERGDERVPRAGELHVTPDADVCFHHFFKNLS